MSTETLPRAAAPQRNGKPPAPPLKSPTVAECLDSAATDLSMWSDLLLRALQTRTLAVRDALRLTVKLRDMATVITTTMDELKL